MQWELSEDSKEQLSPELEADELALDRAIRCGNEKEESVYDTRGLLVF